MTLEFEPIQLEKQQDYTKLLALCPQVASDYSFFNLWAWAEDYGLQWAWDDKLIWIKQTYPETVFWAPVGPWETVEWKKWFGNDNSRRLRFIRVPEKLAEIWRKNMGDLAAIAEERTTPEWVSRDVNNLKGSVVRLPERSEIDGNLNEQLIVEYYKR